MAAPTVYISFISLVLFAIYTFYNRTYLSRNTVFKKNYIGPKASRKLRERNNCSIHRVDERNDKIHLKC